MADQRITQLTSLPKAGVAATDVLPIADISASQTKKVTAKDLVDAGLDLIDASSIDIDKLDQASVTKLSTTALADDAVTAAKLANDSSIAVQTTEPSTDNFEGRGYFNSTSGNLQVFNGSAYQQVVAPTAGIGDLQVTTEKLADGAVTTAKVTALDTAAYADSSVTTAKIADGAVTAAKIATDSITNTQIAPDAVGASELAADAVNTAAIVNLAVTEAKLSDGAVAAAKLGDLAVTNAKIANAAIAYEKLNLADGSIPGAKISADSVTATQLAADAVNTSELVNSAVTTSKIADGAVTAAKIATDSITSAQIAPSAVGASELADNAVDTAAIVDANVTEAKLAGGAVTTNKLGDLAVTDSKIAATTITYGKLNLADGAVPASKLTDATVTGAKLAANAVGTAAVADGAVTTAKVADGAITTAKVADGVITTAKVDVAGLSADAIAADAITTDKVLDGAITGAKMADDSATIVQAGVPTGSGDFEGQQYFDTNTSVQYVWNSTAWIRQAAINTINFTDNTPIAFAIAYPDNHTADVTTTLDTQVANTAFLGPATGADTAPTFRAIVPDDLPDATATTKGVIQPGSGLAVNGGTLNHSNSVAAGTYTKVTVDAQGHISVGALLEAADVPDIDAAKITTGGLVTDRIADDAVTIDKLADYSTASLGEAFPTPASFIGQLHLNPLDKSFYMWDGNVWVPIGISAGQIIFAGTFDAGDPVGIGKIASVTPEGAAAGFTVNSPVPASAPSNNRHYFVVSEGGTITSGNAPNVTLAPPDLILSVYNTSSPGWVEVDVSASAGTVAATQVSFAPAGDISAAATTVQLAIEEVSTECRNASNITSGTLAVARGGTNLASYTKGDVIAASGATTLVKLPVGANGQVLTADSTETSGLKYTTPTVGTVTNVTSGTAALTVATSTTTPALTVRSATTSVNGIVQLSDSTSTTSSTLAATPTAVKSAYDLANAALPKAGGVITGALEIGNTGSLVFEGSTNDGNETTITVADPTADRTITFPNVTGNVVTTGDTGTVTSTMIANSTIVDADISASAAIAPSKLGSGALPSGVTVASANIVDGTIVNADVNASAAIAGTKISPDFGSQNIVTTGTATASGFIPTGSGVPTNGMYLPAVNQLAFSTNGVRGLFLGETGIFTVGRLSTEDAAIELGAGATGNRNSYVDFIGDTTYTDYGLRLGRLNTGANANSQLTHRGTGELQLSTQESAPITFYTGGSERARIDSSGRLLVGASTAQQASSTGLSPYMQLVGGGGSSQATLGVFSNSTTNNASVRLFRNRLTTSGGFNYTGGTVQTNDILGTIEFSGVDASATPIMRSGAVIEAVCESTPTTAEMPTRLVFSTAADGAASPTERMRIASSGNVGIGATSPSALLHLASATGSASPTPTELRIATTTNASDWSTTAPWGRISFYNADQSAGGPKEHVTLDAIAGATNGATSHFAISNNSGSTNLLTTRLFISTQGSTTLTSDSNVSPFIAQIGASEAARIDSSGRLLVGTSSATATNAISNAITPYSQIAGTAIATCSSANVYYADNVNGSPVIQTAKSRGTSVGSHVVVQSGDRIGAYSFAGSDGTAFIEAARIDAFVDGTPGANDMPGRLVFSTTADGSATPTERMRIDSQGRVGIGTTSPSAPLTLAIPTGGSAVDAFQILSPSGGFNVECSDPSAASPTWSLRTFSSEQLAFKIGTSEAGRFDASGRLLVGTSSYRSVGDAFSPANVIFNEGSGEATYQVFAGVSNRADVFGPQLALGKTRGTTNGSATIVQSGDTLGEITFAGADGVDLASRAALIRCEVDGTPGADDMPGRLVFSTTSDGNSSPSERMRIDSAGNVGIGTTSPDAVLTALGSATISSQANVAARIGAGTESDVLIGSINGNAPFISSQGAYSLQFRTNNTTALMIDSSQQILFRNGDSERARIDSAGRLLVGTSTSVNTLAGLGPTLQVNEGTGVAASLLRSTNDTSGANLVFRKTRSTSSAGVTVVQNGDTLGRLVWMATDGTNPIETARITAEVDGTPGANDMPGRLVFSTTADGSSSPTARMTIDSAGNVGIGTTSPSTALQVNGTVTATTFSGAFNATNISSGTLAEARLPFQPIQQGGGTSQGTNKIYIGWSTENVLRLQIDVTDFGATWPIGVSGNAATVTTNANLTGDITSVGNATSIASGVIVNADINASAAIADTKLATISTAGKVSGTAITSGDIDTSGDLEITNLSPNIRLTESDGTATHSQTTLARINDQFLIQTRNSTGTTVSSDYLIPANASGATDHIWRIQNTEAMRIDSSSNVGIGTATPSAPLHVAGLTRLNTTDTLATSTTSAIARTTASNNDGNVSLESVANSTGTRHHISLVNPNGIVGSISTNGSATAYNTSSDYRLKENIAPLTGAIDRLQQIPVHRFNFIADPDTVVDGFIAHEAAAVVPECVTGEKDQVDENGKPIYQGIDQSKIVPLLTAALQEALQKIEDLEARLTAANL